MATLQERKDYAETLHNTFGGRTRDDTRFMDDPTVQQFHMLVKSIREATGLSNGQIAATLDLSDAAFSTRIGGRISPETIGKTVERLQNYALTNGIIFDQSLLDQTTSS